MTKIVVFCDGTWNSPDMAEPTAIVKLYEAVENNSAKDQLAVYFKGIGTTDQFNGKFQQLLVKYGGGAFGWGLDGKVKQAYQFLSMAYKPGDEIILFGFSRGAYTARSVAGMIRKCGLSKDVTPAGINKAFELYPQAGRVQTNPTRRTSCRSAGRSRRASPPRRRISSGATTGPPS